MTYFLLAAAILCSAVLIDLLITKSCVLFTKKCWLTIAALVVLTMVFNNMIVGFGIVEYSDAVLVGIRLPYMPLEDLSYAVAAGILVPSLMDFYET